MVLLGFTVLKDKLLDHSKCQTIRVPRKRPFKVGDRLQIYWFPRTMDSEKLGEAIVTKTERKRALDLTEQDAVLDGFKNLRKLKLALQFLHPYADGYALFDIITFQWDSVKAEKEAV